MESPVESKSSPPIRWDLFATAAAVLIAGWWAGRVAVLENHHEDLWIYSSGSWFGFQGRSPYSTERMHARVAERWAGDPNLDGNNGFFLSPQAMLEFLPFAFLPWTLSKVIWSAFTIALATVAAWQLAKLTTVRPPSWFVAAAVIAVLLNPLSLFVLIVGQTPLFIVSCIVLGQVAHQVGRTRLGAFLWALTFIKPHIALPLLLMAWVLSGWKRAAEVALGAGILNLLAGLVTLGDPFFLRQYFEFLPQGHKSVEFNRVAVNIQITGWNRWLAANGGPIIELGAAGTLAGYAVWFALAAARVWRQGSPPSTSWVLAIGSCGALVCCQLLPYELPLLVLSLPYLSDLLSSARKSDRIAFVALLLIATFTMLPGGEGGPSERFAAAVGGTLDRGFAEIGFPIQTTDALMSHRSLGVLLFSLLVLTRGSVRGFIPVSSEPSAWTLESASERVQPVPA